MHATLAADAHAIRVVSRVIALTFAVLLTAQYAAAAIVLDGAPAKMQSNKSIAYQRAQRAKSEGGGDAASSYFRHNPYGPNTYAYGFEVNDNRTGNVQFRDERRYLNGSVAGSYGHVRPDGRVSITHYMSGNDTGYQSQTRTFAAGEPLEWEEHWPTQRPEILNSHEMLTRPVPIGSVVYDPDQHLNMTAGPSLPPQMATTLQEQHGIGLNPMAVASGAVDATLLDIVNGKIPLQTTKPATSKIPPAKAQADQKPKPTAEAATPSIGFHTAQNLLPLVVSSAITPLQLPPKEPTAESPFGGLAVPSNKYNKAKQNNAEKTITAAALKGESPGGGDEEALAEPLPLAATATPSGGGGASWYQRIINDNRREFLENLPAL